MITGALEACFASIEECEEWIQREYPRAFSIVSLGMTAIGGRNDAGD
jgi:hypothetical protein